MVIFNSYVKLPEGSSIGYGKSIGSPGLSLRKPNCHGLRDVGHAIRLWMGLEVMALLPYNGYYIVIIYDHHPSNHIYIYNSHIWFNHIFIYYMLYIYIIIFDHMHEYIHIDFPEHHLITIDSAEKQRPGGMLHKIRENQKRLEPRTWTNGFFLMGNGLFTLW